MHGKVYTCADLQLALSVNDEREIVPSWELGITLNAAFTTSANVVVAANIARGTLYFINTMITLPNEGNFCTPLQFANQAIP